MLVEPSSYLDFLLLLQLSVALNRMWRPFLWLTYCKSDVELVIQQKVVEGTLVEGLIVEGKLVQRSANEKMVV